MRWKRGRVASVSKNVISPPSSMWNSARRGVAACARLGREVPLGARPALVDLAEQVAELAQRLAALGLDRAHLAPPRACRRAAFETILPRAAVDTRAGSGQRGGRNIGKIGGASAIWIVPSTAKP